MIKNVLIFVGGNIKKQRLQLRPRKNTEPAPVTPFLLPFGRWKSPDSNRLDYHETAEASVELVLHFGESIFGV